MTARRIRTAVWTAIFLTLTACGFHLRGTATGLEKLAPFAVELEAGNRALQEAVTRTLKSAGLALASGTVAANTVLVVEAERSDKRLAVVGGEGQALEYELRYDVQFHVLDGEGDTLLETQTVTLRRDHAMDRSRPLSIGAEQEAIWQEMREEAAYLMVQRLRGLDED